MSMSEIAQFPHCDQMVLHAPGDCGYCDEHPEWQVLRRVWGIAFTGHAPGLVYPDYPAAGYQLPCPSDLRRGQGGAHVWGGNRPTNVEAPEREILGSVTMYGHVGPGWPERRRPE